MDEEPIKIVIPQLEPWFKLIQENNITRLEGVAKNMLDYVARTMNRPYVLLDSNEKNFGNEIEPGNWSGALGMAQRGEADVVLGIHYTTEERYQLFGYTSPVFDTKFGILSGPPRKYEKLVGSLLSSVSLDVWIALSITWIVVSVVSYLMSKVERSWFQKDMKEETLGKTLFSFWGLLFERGFDYLPSTNYRRLVLAVWLILCEVLMSGIGGNLSSKMAVTDVPERIDTIQDILDRPYICPYIANGIILESILKFSEDKLYQNLWKRIQSCNGSIHFEHLLSQRIFDEVNQGLAVIVENVEFIIPEFVSSCCRRKIVPLYLGKEKFSSINLLTVYRKDLDFPSAELYRRSAIAMMQAGALLHIAISNSRSNDPCYAESFLPIPLSALSLSDLNKVFQVWITGLVICTLFLVEELLVKIWCLKKTSLANQQEVLRY